MNTRIIPLLIILIVTPMLLLAQPDEEYEVIVEYSPSNEKNPENTSTAKIALETFNAKFIEQGSFVELRWKLNNNLSAFVVEHSTDGEVYNQIGIVNGTSGFEADYFIFQAREFDPKFNFYRLKQIIDGKIIYSKVLSLSVSANDDTHTLELENLPDEKRIIIRVRDKQNVTIKLINSDGVIVQELLNETFEINEIMLRTINKGSFLPGDYFLLIEGELFKQSKKIRLP